MSCDSYFPFFVFSFTRLVDIPDETLQLSLNSSVAANLGRRKSAPPQYPTTTHGKIRQFCAGSESPSQTIVLIMNMTKSKYDWTLERVADDNEDPPLVLSSDKQVITVGRKKGANDMTCVGPHVSRRHLKFLRFVKIVSFFMFQNGE